MIIIAFKNGYSVCQHNSQKLLKEEEFINLIYYLTELFPDSFLYVKDLYGENQPGHVFNLARIQLETAINAFFYFLKNPQLRIIA